MGGSYFSNGIALNTIEDAAHPGKETWANINAIDDIVEFLLSDSSDERSAFMRDEPSLSARGITTVACVRSNAAAGGVALAAACDVVIGARSVVLNPAYRAMGLHGSEFHS
jgi:enoyl-CoA hydratase/carnithine racemase